MIGSRPGELSPGESRTLADHLAGCPTCGARAAALTLTGGLLSEALLAEADRRELGSFADQVMAAVRTGPAPRRTSPVEPAPRLRCVGS